MLICYMSSVNNCNSNHLTSWHHGHLSRIESETVLGESPKPHCWLVRKNKDKDFHVVSKKTTVAKALEGAVIIFCDCHYRFDIYVYCACMNLGVAIVA